MKISDKEKIMLCILGIIIIGFGYYQFIYSHQLIQLQQKIKAESEITQKYNNAMNTINSMESKKSDVKILNAKIGDQALPFYPIISEEHIIIELDKLLNDNGLKGAITFQPIVSNSVENSKKEEKSLAESSLQGIVDKYNSTFNNTEKTVDNSTKSETNNASGTSNTNSTSNSNENNSNSSNASNNKDSKDTKKNTVQYIKCEIKFEGSYENLDKFLNTIGNNEKKIVVNSIKMSSDTSGVKGTINLEIYSVPKINDELETYLKWDLNKTYGKSVPFSAGMASTASNTSVTGGTTADNSVSNSQVNKEQSDFIASVKPTASDLPTIMMGKAKDDLRTTYVYADSNSVENIEMVLTQQGDKYYYKYKTSKGTFPANYDGLGAEFAPASNNIVLDILSEVRLNANDSSAIRFKILNNTDRVVNININGDDSSNPRVAIESDGTNVKIS